MTRTRSSISPPRVGFLLATLGLTSAAASADDRLPNNFPFFNGAGTAATFSTAGFVDLSNPFHVPQGSNGRSCETCHLPQVGWSIRPSDVELKFFLSRGADPIFNALDADNPNPDVSSLQAKRASYSMLRKGLFRRGGTVPANAEYQIVKFDDPLGAGAGLATFRVFRRPLATANFHIAMNVGWHDQDTNGSGDVHAGLRSQALGNINGAQQSQVPPADATLESIASYELGLSFAQQFSFKAGLLTACGAQGGPENLSAQQPVVGRFDLFDAWKDLKPGSCGSRSVDRARAQIARGQELFNGVNPQNGRSCNGCHSASNNGSNINGTLFDIHVSQGKFRQPGMPLYTVRNIATQQERETTDPGRALRSGRWADMDKFKVPSLRGLSARAPYFHNGIATTLLDVVRHYETELNFEFSDEEEQDLVAFLEAL